MTFDKFAPGILAVIKGRATGAEAYLACMKDGEESPEIDFLVESTCGIVPIEAKAERNLQAKSLGVYRAKFAPPFAVRTSLAAPHEADGLWDIPLWALGSICNRLV